MRLLVDSDDTSLVALDDLETYLSPSTGGVAVNRVGDVLKAIRETASAIKPATLSPAQLESISTAIFSTASHARALAEKSPDDPDAQIVLATLDELGL